MTEEKNSLAADIALATTLAPVGGYLGGIVKSWVDPLTLIKEVRYIRNKGLNSLSLCSGHVFGAIGYGTETYEIISALAEDPKDIKNYVPLVTNLIGAGVQIALWAYRYGKKQGLEEKIRRNGK